MTEGRHSDRGGEAVTGGRRRPPKPPPDPPVCWAELERQFADHTEALGALDGGDSSRTRHHSDGEPVRP